MTNMSEELKRTLGIIGGAENELAGILDDVETSAADLGVDGEEPKSHEIRVLDVKQMESEVPALAGTDAKTDYVYARNMTYTLLDLTGSALAGALVVAQETEHPRAFGVFNELASTMRELTKDLIQLQKTFKEVTKDRDEMTPPVVTKTVNNTQNNFMGAGSTTDLLDMLDQARREKELADGVVVGDAIDDEEQDGNSGTST